MLSLTHPTHWRTKHGSRALNEVLGLPWSYDRMFSQVSALLSWCARSDMKIGILIQQIATNYDLPFWHESSDSGWRLTRRSQSLEPDHKSSYPMLVYSFVVRSQCCFGTRIVVQSFSVIKRPKDLLSDQGFPGSVK